MADIYFRSNGRIDITARVVKALSIHKGDVIDIWEEDGEQYLYVMHRAEEIRGDHVATCNPTQNRKNSFMRAYSTALCRHIRNLTGHLEEAHLYIGEPVVRHNIGTAVPLITKNNLYKG